MSVEFGGLLAAAIAVDIAGVFTGTESSSDSLSKVPMLEDTVSVFAEPVHVCGPWSTSLPSWDMQ